MCYYTKKPKCGTKPKKPNQSFQHVLVIPSKNHIDGAKINTIKFSAYSRWVLTLILSVTRKLKLLFN